MIKEQVKVYWEASVCEASKTTSPRYSKEYFDEIEEYRYSVSPEVFEFAQFTRWHGKKVLEVGVGAGTDFLQYIRASADAYGLDLTEEAIRHTKTRLESYGFRNDNLIVGDAEYLPYQHNMFDLVYSWGVLHHTPNTEKAISEIIRVTKPGGRIKLMLYNRRSTIAFFVWAQVNILERKFPKSISSSLYHGMESIGTHAYTFEEVRQILSQYPVRILGERARVAKRDLLHGRPWPFSTSPFRTVAYMLACLMGFDKAGFFMTLDLTKV